MLFACVSLFRPPYNFFTVSHSLSFQTPLPRGEGSRLVSELFLGFVSKLAGGSVYAGDYVNFQHELHENWSVLEKLFEWRRRFVVFAE